MTTPAALPVPRRDRLRAHCLDGLVFDGVPLHAIAREVGTPGWVLSAGLLRDRIAALRAALDATTAATGLDIAPHYAVKANDALAVLALMAESGLGADVVSGGELAKARQAGMPAGRIIFSGVGKTRAELEEAVAAGIAQVNVESHEELDELSAAATRVGRPVRTAIRVNPDVAAPTLDQIATGRAGDKFGVSWRNVPALYRRGTAAPGLEMVGLAVHIGSQINRAEAFTRGYERVASLVRELRADGLAVASVDCGGGLAIPYRGDEGAEPAVLAGALARVFAGMDLRLAIEPGRWLVGPAGLLLCRAVRVKRVGEARPFLILDAAMNDLLRPALYGAWHDIVPVDAAVLARPAEAADVVGPVCESSDVFARDRSLPLGGPGALYAILDAGAYGAVMSSTYNARPLAAQVMVDAGRHALIRPRDAIADLWRTERLPDWTASDPAGPDG